MKRAFTLIEVVVSIAIFSIIAIYLYQAINTAKNSNDIYSARFSEDEKKQKVTRLFYNDFFLQNDIYASANITHKDDFDEVRLKTRNSLHAMINPIVIYFVKDGTLFRIESRENETIPLGYESAQRVKLDKLLENVDIFRIYENKNSYLISYRSEGVLSTYEIALPPRQSASNSSNISTPRP